MKTLLTIGTSHVESGHDYLDTKRIFRAEDKLDPEQIKDYFYKTWPGHLQTNLDNTRVINLGVSGHGLDYIITRTRLAIDHFNPDTIILEYPTPYRYTIAGDVEFKDYGNVLYNISHVFSDSEFHWCDNINNQIVLNPNVNKKYKRFNQEWLEYYGILDLTNHQQKFTLLCDYIINKGINLLCFSINSDGTRNVFNMIDEIMNISIPDYLRKYFIHDKNNNLITHLQGYTIDKDKWIFSTDGRGHAGPITERWWVDEIFLPNLARSSIG